MLSYKTVEYQCLWALLLVEENKNVCINVFLQMCLKYFKKMLFLGELGSKNEGILKYLVPID